MQDEVAALKAENLRMKQRDEELSAKVRTSTTR